MFVQGEINLKQGSITPVTAHRSLLKYALNSIWFHVGKYPADIMTILSGVLVYWASHCQNWYLLYHIPAYFLISSSIYRAAHLSYLDWSLTYIGWVKSWREPNLCMLSIPKEMATCKYKWVNLSLHANNPSEPQLNTINSNLPQTPCVNHNAIGAKFFQKNLSNREINKFSFNGEPTFY